MDEEKIPEMHLPVYDESREINSASTTPSSSDLGASNDSGGREMEKPAREAQDITPAKSDMSLPHEVAFVAVICMAQLLTQSGLGMVMGPILIIGDSFNVRAEGALSWYAAAYSLTVGTFILPAGRLGDVYGHKRIFIIGWLVYALFSLVAGFSAYVTPGPQGSKFFNVMRAFQGMGPAILLPNAIAILGTTYPQGKRKNMVFSLFGATAPAGGVVGLAFSGMLAQLAWWPWAFWIMGITTFLMAVLAFFVIPKGDSHLELTMVESRASWKSLWARLDISGAITGVTGLVLINIAWNQGPVVSWTTTYVYVLLIIGFLFMGAFIYIEYTVSHPLIPIRDIGREVAFVLGCVSCGWASFGIWYYYLTQILLVLRHHTPLSVAAQVSPVAVSGFIAAILTGLILHKVGAKVTMVIAMFGFCVGNILLATMPVNQTYWAQTFVSIIVAPWGMDMSFPSATIILSDSVPRKYQGMAASLVTTVVNYSISIGLGFAGTVESEILKHGADTLGGYRSAWYVGIGLSGLGIAVAVAFNIFGVKAVQEKTEESEGSA